MGRAHGETDQGPKDTQMERNYEQFPDDAIGDVLWKMREGGDKLGVAREVDFAVIFPAEQAAMDFAQRLLRYGQKVSFGPYEGEAAYPWQVIAHPIMVASHEHVSGYQRQLGKDADRLGGQNAGWGCYGRE